MTSGNSAAFGEARQQITARLLLLRSASPFAVLVAGALTAVQPAHAQSATETAQAPAVEEIVVTGSRVVRNGYEAPTPLTVVGVDQIQDNATSNIADFLNQ